ncbi:MAG TPA: type II toxin-antitoxin system VapC family toxin [Dermatophilaceae bacterium]|nr:type II toxin-antitoxin system VapC family toxin [Dermatophilaceae bacterium]
MILVDTSVWVDHLRRGVPALSAQLERNAIGVHPLVVGELALGSLRERQTVLDLLRALLVVVQAEHEEVLHLVEQSRLHGRGLSIVDAHLLASARLTNGCRLWTRDKPLRAAAVDLGLAYEAA